jgi:hypothetical protein
VLRQVTVSDPPPGGNGNGRFDPGETGDLLIALRNVGNEPADNVTAKLRSSHNLFVLTDSLSSYGDIEACSTRTGDAFTAQVDQSMPLETPVPLTLFVNGDGYCDTLRYTVIVGQIREVDPVPDGPRAPALYWAYDDVDVFYRQHPDFSWVEVNGVGTQLTLSDDQTVQLDLPSGFTWQFYGQQFSQISICGNGWVSPGYTTSSTYTNYGLPTTNGPAMVAACWDDLYPPTGNGVWYYHDAANHRFIVEWDSVAYYGAQTVMDKFQVVLYDQTVSPPSGDNVVLVQYLTANYYSYMTAGIQDPTMTIGIQCVFDNAYHRGTAALAPGRAIKYVTLDPTGIAERPGDLLLAAALRVSPNPFRGSVVLNAPALGCAEARVYDNNGRLVRTLTGTGRWTWDGRDAQGLRVAPGVYFCRVTSGSAEAGTKLVLER